MVHYTQKIKNQNIEEIRKIIAKAMPNGIEDQKLRAWLGYKFGFSGKKTTEYLSILENLSLVECQNGIWKMLETEVPA